MSNISAWGGGTASILSGVSSVMAGQAANDAARYSAQQMDAAALAAGASAQRASFEERRKGDLLVSSLQARAGAADVGTTNLAANIAGESEYRALLAMYEGETEAAGMRAQAEATRFEGRSREWAGNVSGLSSFLEGGSTLYSKYGQGGPGRRFEWSGMHDLSFTNQRAVD